MSNMIAISATILMCVNGQLASKGECADGKRAEEVTVNILNGTSEDCSISKQQDCFERATWDSILKIERNGSALFEWRADGSVIRDPSFSPDIAASAFMEAVSEVLKTVGVNLRKPQQ
ncbi:hypothetical protein [Bradyrhizobium betae]|uniref:Uncharacterized protein n=1 Tax=Bradyrhizobium betae TaxID=244734 RepID=A0A5P6NZ56_9BRAD|nr:hypothetical protein [Bradyrhizobium betae]MCS3725474.1 hypothetical protein [Bradyrhizobium betae]QFI71235.1 hypothetical protein F8237_01905 [Bradyrhizobium betae]